MCILKKKSLRTDTVIKQCILAEFICHCLYIQRVHRQFLRDWKFAYTQQLILKTSQLAFVHGALTEFCPITENLSLSYNASDFSKRRTSKAEQRSALVPPTSMRMDLCSESITVECHHVLASTGVSLFLNNVFIFCSKESCIQFPYFNLQCQQLNLLSFYFCFAYFFLECRL